MSDLYDRIDQICKARETNVTAICKKAGVGRATLSELKAGRTKALTIETARKLADALQVSTNFLIGDFTDDAPIKITLTLDNIQEYLARKKAPADTGERITDDAIKFALFGGDGEITDAMYDEVRRFAQMVKLREEAEKKER